MTSLPRFRTVVILGTLVAGFAASDSLGDESTDVSGDAAQMRFFESHVRPLLAEKCWNCHAGSKRKGGLRLDSLDHVLDGGDSGAAIVAGAPDESLLIEAVQYEQMPPSGPLSDSEIAVLVRWIEAGAYWPESDTFAPPSSPAFSQEDRSWWAIGPIANPAVPQTAGDDWCINPIDRFVLDQMQSHGLSPAPAADRIDLARRVYFDVVGLPPTPEQIQAFVNDDSADAYQRLVDQLLDSPGYGEHAARQWLDLVRYADSDGYNADHFRPDAWRYRDYVIESFNDDKPYSRFVQEQLAADELFPDDVDAAVGLGYLRSWVYEVNQSDAERQWKIILEDITDTTADVFLGLGLQCAKCHDHKFDPLLQKDYFRLQAFFSPIVPVDRPFASADRIEGHLRQQSRWEADAAKITQEIVQIEAPYREKLKSAALVRFPEEVQAIYHRADVERSPYEKQIADLVEKQVAASIDPHLGDLSTIRQSSAGRSIPRDRSGQSVLLAWQRAPAHG